MPPITPRTSFRPEVVTHIRFLPGCRACGSRHPLAIDTAADPSRCLACRSAMPPLDDGETVPAVLTGASAAMGRVLMAIGRWFARLSR